MSNAFFGLEIAKKALQAQQAAMDVTGHNIANSNTVGYTRQSPKFTQETVSSGGLFVLPHLRNLGAGVSITEVQRLRDKFIDLQIRQESRTASYWKTVDDGLAQIEVIFGEPQEGALSEIFDRFWNTWQELAKSPESQAARALVAETANLLSTAFNHTYNQFVTQQQQLNEKVAIKVDEVNNYVQQIYDLNQQIVRLSLGGGNANDYKDQLDVLVDKLSNVLDFQVSENSNGTYSLILQGRILVSDKEKRFLEVEANSTTGFWEVKFQGEEQINLDYQNGELKALFYLRDEVIEDYKDYLNDLAGGIINAVNTANAQGYTLEEPQVKGGDFFVGSDAATIALDSSIDADPNKIAASSTGAPGDGENALAVARLRDEGIINGSTPDDYYRGVVSRLGVEKEESNRILTNQNLLIDQLDMRKEAVSGVSLDEEMTNLIKYQHAYEAASVLTRTVDEMLDTLINKIR